MFTEDNGQWLDCNGKPCFCPDNSPQDIDWENLDDLEQIPNLNPQSKSQNGIEYDEF